MNQEANERADTILALLGLSWEELQGKKILDVGASDAKLAIAAKARGIAVVCLDRKPPVEAYVDIEYVIADAEKMPFDDDSFDLIVAVGVLHDSAEMFDKAKTERTLSEMKRVLRVGGEIRFGIAEGNLDLMHTIEPELALIYTRTKHSPIHPEGRAQYFYRYIKL